MGKLGWVGLAALAALACGGGGSGEDADAGIDNDPCDPIDRVGVCPPRGIHAVPLNVELRAPEAGDTIHYTLDGSEPTESSPMYSDALSIDADVGTGGVRTIRAFASHTDGTRTAGVVHSYVFPAAVLAQPALPRDHPETWGFGANTRAGDYEMDPRAIANASLRQQAEAALAELPSVSIVVPHADLWAPSSGIYMRPSASGTDWERASSVEFLLPDGTSRAVRAGLSIQGGSSTTNWKAAKLSMRLKFVGEHGDGKVSVPLFADSDVTQFANLVLDAHLNNTWIHPDAGQRSRALYVHDQYVAALQNQTGSLAPHSQPVHLYLNGIYWGLYDLHERPDAHFASDYLGGGKDEWDVIRHDGSTIVDGDAVAWNDMLAIVRGGLSDSASYQMLGEFLDIDDFINYMLVNFYAGNTDWDHHNWYAARKREAGAGYRFFSWDAEHVLLGVDVDVTGTENAGAPTELYQALLANAEFRSQLSVRAGELYGEGGPFFVNQASPQWNPSAPENNRPAETLFKLTEAIGGAIVCESARWGDNRTPDQPYLQSDWSAMRTSLLNDYFPMRSQQAAGQIPTP